MSENIEADYPAAGSGAWTMKRAGASAFWKYLVSLLWDWRNVVLAVAGMERNMYYTTLNYYIGLFDSAEREFAFAAGTTEEFQRWKQALRERLGDISGMNRCIPCEPDHEILGQVQVEGFQAEYHTLETEPGIWMPFYLLKPSGFPDQAQNGGKGLPILIIPHGHGGGKETVLKGQKKFVQEALDDGFVVACPDERGSGDRREFPQQGDDPDKRRSNSHRELLQVGINFGRTVIGTAVWDLMRLADHLLSLSETGEFLACAGMSGGGQQALWFAALDDRVRAAITSGYFYGFRESLLELPQNCACNFVPHLFETADMGELGALIAPRPFFVESGEKDPLSGRSGVENVRRQLDVTRKAYGLFHAQDKVIHSVHPGGHQWVGAGMREFLRKAQYL